MGVNDTDFGRLRRAMLCQGQGDRVPLFELSIDKSIKAAILGRPVREPQDEIAFCRLAGYDFVSARAGVRSVVRGLHPAVREWHKARHEVAQDKAGWVGEHSAIIRSRQEFDAFPWPQAENLGGYNDYESLEDYLETMGRCLPPDMKLLVQLGYNFMGTWQLMGFEHFCTSLADDVELVESIFNKLGTLQLEVLEILLQYDCVGAIWLADDLCYNTGPVVSPRVLKKYVCPWYVQTVERCHRADLPVGLHSDGNLDPILADLVACGFDCIHPFEPPMNDIVAVKRLWGDRLAVAGNIDLKETLCAGRPEDVEAEVREKAAALASSGGWLLGSSNSIPDFVPVENYRALLAAGLRYGRHG